MAATSTQPDVVVERWAGKVRLLKPLENGAYLVLLDVTEKAWEAIVEVVARSGEGAS